MSTERDTGSQKLPHNIRNLWLKALTAYEIKNYERAVGWLKFILERYPDFQDARDLLKKCEEGDVGA